ncbi:MAG: hypothetical protein Q4F67_00085 [Propionibacteriaceae bacterium]|nr:hypothetical protein [Propionibacteriaceae bacterium]
MSDALAPGLTPVPTGARIGARLLDTFLAALALAGVTWLALELLAGWVPSFVGILGGLVFLVWFVGSLWAVLGRGARLGGLFLGQRWVQADGEGAPGGAVLGKLLAQAAIGALTFGIGEPILSLASRRPPHNRTWFDRITGLTLVTGTPVPQLARPVGPFQPDHLNVRQIDMPAHHVTVAPAPPAPPAPLPGHPAPPDPWATMLAPHGSRVRPTPWLLLDDGTRIELDSTVVLGRDPASPPGMTGATPRALTDPRMELSKTHLAVGPDPAGVWALDLHATNGVRAAGPGEVPVPLPPGEPVPLAIGARVEFGGRWLEVHDD